MSLVAVLHQETYNALSKPRPHAQAHSAGDKNTVSANGSKRNMVCYMSAHL